MPAARDRKGRQLSIELPPDLLLSLRAEALRRQQSAAVLVRGWIEAGLRGELPAPGAADPGQADRLGALEDRLVALEADAVQRPHLLALEARLGALEARQQRPASGPVPAAVPVVVAPPLALELAPADAGTIPTATLAERLGVSRQALNERLRRLGGARVGLELEGWRCVGKETAARGGPAQWQWRPLVMAGGDA